MKKAIQFGAGNIGRGFIGYLLSASGYHVIFADINQQIVDAINTDKRYLVEMVGETVQKEYVEDISAINSSDKKLIDEISEVGLITTAVGPNILGKIAPTIALGIQKRYENNNNEYLNIIPCENMVGSGDHLKVEVQKHLNEEEIEFMNSHIGFVNSVVDRIVPPMEDNVENIIHVRVEEFSEWIVDKTKFKGDIPSIKNMECTDNLIAYTERKLFTLNTGHAITAYIGYLDGYDTIRQSILDSHIEKIVLGAMDESGEVLINRYGFDREKHSQYIKRILSRFKNPYLKDEVVRVGRQPLRKLGGSDRLIKPLRGTIEYNLGNENLIKGIAAALSYDYHNDEEAVRMQDILKQNTIERGIAMITGLDINSKEIASIKDEYLKINSRVRD